MADREKDIENIDEVPGRTQTKPCQPCVRKNANNVAEVYCEDCGEYQCNECSKVHQHFPVMATHKLMNISDAQFKSRRYDMKGLDLCKEHGKILKFLCEDDNKLCCDVEQYLTDIENVTQLGTPSQQMIMLHYIKDKVQQLQQNTTKNMQEFKKVRMTFEFDDFLKLSPTKSVLPGRLAVEYLTASDSQGDSKEKQQKDQKVNLKLLASIDLKQGKGDVEDPWYTGLDFLPDGRLVTVDNMNQKCLMYNEQLHVLGSFALPNVSLDVVAVSRDEVAITTANAKLIQVIKILDNNKLLLKERIKVMFEYVSISIIDSEHFAVGTMNDPQPVRIVSVSGEDKESGINFPTKTYPVGDSSCTYIQKCNKVVLTDRVAHTVYIYDIASNTRVEVKDEKIIKQPCGVAVGLGNCIFVSCDETNTLVQISYTGQILSSHELDMVYPHSVSVSKDNTKLAVSNSAIGLRKLQLYSIEIQ